MLKKERRNKKGGKQKRKGGAKKNDFRTFAPTCIIVVTTYSKNHFKKKNMAKRRENRKKRSTRTNGKWKYDPKRRRRPIVFLPDGRVKGNTRGSEDNARFCLSAMVTTYRGVVGKKDRLGREIKSIVLKQWAPEYVPDAPRWRRHGSFDSWLRDFGCPYMWVSLWDPDKKTTDFYYWLITGLDIPFDAIEEGVAIIRTNSFFASKSLITEFDPTLVGALQVWNEAIDSWSLFSWNERMWACRGWAWHMKRDIKTRIKMVEYLKNLAINPRKDYVRGYYKRSFLKLRHRELLWLMINQRPSDWFPYDAEELEGAREVWRRHKKSIIKAYRILSQRFCGSYKLLVSIPEIGAEIDLRKSSEMDKAGVNSPVLANRWFNKLLAAMPLLFIDPASLGIAQIEELEWLEGELKKLNRRGRDIAEMEKLYIDSGYRLRF